MASKSFNIDGIGDIKIYKRKGSKRIRLTVGHDGMPSVGIPAWAPYKFGIEFAKSKHEWLVDQLSNNKPHIFSDGESIGKAHRISIVHSATKKPRCVVKSQLVKLYLPSAVTETDKTAQAILIKGCQRALKEEAKMLLPQRLRQASLKTGYGYKNITIKQLKSRWGSCSQHKEIVLNSYLMQLPWDLIDYVILHELVHTKVMAHGPRFWAELAQHVTDLPTKRKKIKEFTPRLAPRATIG